MQGGRKLGSGGVGSRGRESSRSRGSQAITDAGLSRSDCSYTKLYPCSIPRSLLRIPRSIPFAPELCLRYGR